jgi:hypothetical protein
MNLGSSLVLNRSFHSLFGAERCDDLRRSLNEYEEGIGFDGHSSIPFEGGSDAPENLYTSTHS